MKKYFFGILLLIFSLIQSGQILSAELANIQLAIATPDPVVAGGDITLQVIVVNSGPSKWVQGEYYIEAEIYDAGKNYLAKTSRIKGNSDVAAGMTNLFYIPFNVSTRFVGTYFYKVKVFYKEQVMAESDYTSFGVIPIPTSHPKSAGTVKLGGNAVLSYRQSSLYEGKDYTGNFNLNIVGQVMEHAMLLNLYTFHTPKSTSAAEGISHEIYTILFNYYGDNWNIGVGDILPSFSPLSLYGTGMRGGLYEYKSGIFSMGLAGARMVKPVEGNDSSNGTYERWLLGGKGGFEMPYQIAVSGSYLTSFDKQESINNPGPSLMPANNNVIGGTILWTPSDLLALNIEYQNSNYWADIRKSSSSISDYAYRSELRITPENLLVRMVYQETRPNFYAFGSPGATKDRQTIDLYTNYKFFERFTVNCGLNRFRDNLDSNPQKVITTQNILTTGVSYVSPGQWPSPSLNYSMNEAVGNPRSAQDNITNSIGLGLTSKVSIVNFGVNFQQTNFRDKNKISDDIDTNIMGLALNSALSSRVNLNVGGSLTNNRNATKNISSIAPSYSVSVNVAAVPERLAAQIWATMVTRNNDAANLTDKIDQKETNCNIELTWSINPSLAWTIGTSYSERTDRITTSNNSIINALNTRLNYSF